MQAKWACVMLLAGAIATGAQAAESSRAELERAAHKRPDLEHGAELFKDCAACHGANGDGAESSSAPRIGGQHFRVLLHQLVDYRHELRWDIRMEHYAGRALLNDAQSLADVAAYASRLESKAPAKVGDGSLVARGSEIYTQHCASCHGDKAEGSDEAAIPRIAGQHYEYLLRQMYDAVDGRRPNFSAAHIRLLAKLDRDSLVGVADFLSRQQ
jgi:cytochrome c553